MKPDFSDIIIDLYALASQLDDNATSFKLKTIANTIAKLGNEYHEQKELSYEKN